jgi:phage-related protein
MDNDMFNDIGVEYSTNVELETNLIEYNPYFIENPSEAEDIELNLLLYDPYTMKPLAINQYNIDEIYDWLITDNFVPFISDDNRRVIYYFKVVKLTKVLNFDKYGYLKVVFKPYSKYCYRREENEAILIGNEIDVVEENEEIIELPTVSGKLDIYNYSKILYKPIIEIINLGNENTINKINDMEITGLANNEKIIIDNLTKLVQTEDGINKFNCCNAKWIELKPKDNSLKINGLCRIRVICEFPILY